MLLSLSVVTISLSSLTTHNDIVAQLSHIRYRYIVQTCTKLVKASINSPLGLERYINRWESQETVIVFWRDI
jgi:hypothetical protein